MSEGMEFWGLAPGDSISQGCSLREFRYSQFSECPSAPFNTPGVMNELEFIILEPIGGHTAMSTVDTGISVIDAALNWRQEPLLAQSKMRINFLKEAQCLPSQFRCSDSLTTSPFLESEGPKYVQNDGTLGASPGSPCLSKNLDVLDEGVRCTTQCGAHLQSGPSCSDSLGLSLFDECHSSKERDSSPRHIYCDPRLLEEETQVSDEGLLLSMQQDSHLVSPEQENIKLAPLQPEKSPSLLAVIQECSAAVEDFVDIIQAWHNRRKIAPAATAHLSSSASIGLPFESKQENIESSTSDGLDADLFRGQPSALEPVNAGLSTATIQKTSPAVEDDDNVVQRWHNRKRISLSATTNLSSSLDIGMHKKLKQTTENLVGSSITHPGQPQGQVVEDPTIIDPKNCVSGCEGGRRAPVAFPPGVNVDTDGSCDSKLLEREQNHSCSRDLKSIWQPVAGSKRVEEGKWSCPRKYRPGGRQRTMDAWVT